MDLTKSREQLERAEDYLSLCNDLEAIVLDNEPILTPIRNFLEEFVRNKRKILESKLETLGLEAQYEGKNAAYEQRIIDLYGSEEAARRIKEMEEKTDSVRIREYKSRALKSAALSILSLPFSRKISKTYFDITKSYLSAIKTVKKTITTQKNAEDIRKGTIGLVGRLDQLEAKVVTELTEGGIDERTAVAYVKNPEEFVYQTLDHLKEIYG